VVLAQLVGHAIQAAEDLAVPPRELAERRRQRRARAAVADADDSCMKRLKKTVWRASSTCCVVRKNACSSRGAASMYGDRLSVTDSSPWKNSAKIHSAPRRCSSDRRSCQSTRSWLKSISVARQLPFSHRA